MRLISMKFNNLLVQRPGMCGSGPLGPRLSACRPRCRGRVLPIQKWVAESYSVPLNRKPGCKA